MPANWPHLTGIAAHWDKNTNVAAAFDRWWMNLFPRETPYIASPGGYQTLNFIPALATMIFGLLAGELLQSGQAPGGSSAGWSLAGLIGLALGWGFDHWGICPLVKRIWTPSWTLFSTGWVLLTLAGFYAVVDILGFRRWTFPFVVVGMNSILIYVMAELLARLVRSAGCERTWGEVFTLWGLVPAVYSPLVRGHLPADDHVAGLLLVLPAEDFHPDLTPSAHGDLHACREVHHQSPPCEPDGTWPPRMRLAVEGNQ